LIGVRESEKFRLERWRGVFRHPWEDAHVADKRALKLIGIVFGTLTLMVISTGAVVVAGSATSSAEGGYLASGYISD
jgi:hypothetical protein